MEGTPKTFRVGHRCLAQKGIPTSGSSCARTLYPLCANGVPREIARRAVCGAWVPVHSCHNQGLEAFFSAWKVDEFSVRTVRRSVQLGNCNRLCMCTEMRTVSVLYLVGRNCDYNIPFLERNVICSESYQTNVTTTTDLTPRIVTS